MKAAVFHEPHQPLTIENVEHAPLKRREVLVRTAFAGLCHSDLHFMEGLYPFPTPCVLGHEAAGVIEAVGDDVTYVKPGDHVITCLSVFCGECAQCMTGHPEPVREHRGEAAARCGASSDLEGRGAEPGVQPVGLRREDAGARACGGEGARRRAAGSLRAGRLRRDDRRRRGVPCGQGGARLHRRGDRLRRHRAVRGERRGDGRCLAHHRDRHRGVEAGRGAADGRHRHDQRLERRSGGDGEGDDRRRRAVFVRGDRHQDHRRAVVRRCCVRAAPRRSSA